MATSNIEKFLHVRELHGKCVVRQTIKKYLSVSLLRDPVIEQRKHSPVGPRSDQPAEALLQGNGRLRDLVIVKGIPASLTYIADPRFHHGIVGHRKGQLIDDNAAQLLARDVDA